MYKYAPTPLDISKSDVLREAIDGYHTCICHLFHVFSPQQVDQQWEKMTSDTGAVQSAASSCITAIAAVGARYWDNDVQQPVEEECYDRASHGFEKVLETNPLDALKVCTLLAMYNIVDKSTVALSWVGKCSPCMGDEPSYRLTFRRDRAKLVKKTWFASRSAGPRVVAGSVA